MLCDDITQHAVAVLRSRLDAIPVLSAKHVIAPSRFYMVLNEGAKKKAGVPRSLLEATKLMKVPGRECLWILELRNQHEIAIKIDFAKRTICYGKFYLVKPNKDSH